MVVADWQCWCGGGGSLGVVVLAVFLVSVLLAGTRVVTFRVSIHPDSIREAPNLSCTPNNVINNVIEDYRKLSNIGKDHQIS